jgi:hypothetical protein
MKKKKNTTKKPSFEGISESLSMVEGALNQFTKVIKEKENKTLHDLVTDNLNAAVAFKIGFVNLGRYEQAAHFRQIEKDLIEKERKALIEENARLKKELDKFINIKQQEL